MMLELETMNHDHLVTAARFFERRWRDDPRDTGIRRVYLALRARIDEVYPVVIPPEPELCEAALDDDDHPDWQRYFDSEFCRWMNIFDTGVDTVGYVFTRKCISEAQAGGQPVLAVVAS